MMQSESPRLRDRCLAKSDIHSGLVGQVDVEGGDSMALRRSLVRLQQRLHSTHHFIGGLMKGRIACSADRLSLLEPAMISSVVEPNAFQLGKQYQAERRVQMVDASDTELTSSVMGNSGLYEQAIRLTQGYLEAKCSCTLS